MSMFIRAFMAIYKMPLAMIPKAITYIILPMEKMREDSAINHI